LHGKAKLVLKTAAHEGLKPVFGRQCVVAHDAFFITRHVEQALTIIGIQKIPSAHSNIPSAGEEAAGTRKTDGDDSPKAPGRAILDGKHSRSVRP